MAVFCLWSWGRLRSARKELEGQKALNHEENKFRRLLETAPDAIIIVDRKASIQLANTQAEKIFGYSREELIGNPVELLIPKKFRERHVHSRDAYVQKPHTRPMGAGMELFGLRKNGTEFPVEISLSPLQTEGEMNVTAVIRDVTETRMKERLATIGQLSGNIAHELRNPLATIDSSAYFIRKKLQNADPKLEEHLSRIQNSVVSATSVIESLLDMTRMKAPQLNPLNVIDVLEDSFKSAKLKPKVEVARQFSETQIPIRGDAQQLKMVFVNLIQNAMDAISGAGKLTVAAKQIPSGGAEITFVDTGSGIAPQHLENIFNPLFSTKATGIGFGLSIAKMIIERHRGRIEASSEPGAGTTFTIRLPAGAEGGA